LGARSRSTRATGWTGQNASRPSLPPSTFPAKLSSTARLSWSTICEALAGTPSPTPPSNKEVPPAKQNIGLCPAGKFNSLNQQTCVELKVSEPCGSGESYNSLLNQCKSAGSQAARLVCGNGQILVDGKCIKPLITPTCSPSEIYSFVQDKCVPRDLTSLGNKRCGATEVRVLDTCIPLRQLN
jgi:hypothetical protein